MRLTDIQTEGKETALLPKFAREMLREIKPYLTEPGLVFPAVDIAASQVFGIKSSKNNGPMNEHPYHIEIIGESRQTIKKLAQNWLAEKAAWPSCQKLIEIE